MRDGFRSIVVVAVLTAIGCSTTPVPPAVPTKQRYQAPDERVVFFGAGSAELRNAEAFFALGYVSALLDQNRALHVLVIGRYADRRSGDGADIEGMAWRRARAVREKLMAHGIGADRILLGVPRVPKQQALAPNMARRAEVFVYDPVEDEASQRLGYEVELRKE